MGGSGSASKAKSENQNQAKFGQDVFGKQASALGDMYNYAGNLFGGSMPDFMDQANRGRDVSSGATEAGARGAQNQMAGGAYGGLGIGDQLMESLNQSQNNPSAMQDVNAMIMGGSGNNYADAMKNTYMQDADRAQNLMLGNLDSRAAGSGMSGGARQGVAQAQGMQDINQNLQKNLAKTGFSSFDKDLDRKLQIAQQADQGTMGRQKLMSNMLGNQNKAMQYGTGYNENLFKQGANMQQLPWNALSKYSGALGSPTVLGSGFGSGSGNSKASATGGGGGVTGGKGG